MADQPALDIFEEGKGNGSGDTPVEVEDNKSVAAPKFHVPKPFLELARGVALHSDERRWALLYRLLWRLTHGERKLLEISVDHDVALAFEFQKAIRRDMHKMRAFVRFREVAYGDGKWFVAWFEPAHHIVEHNARFFVDRFASMRWSILTPDRCAHWDGSKLTFTVGVDRSQGPGDEPLPVSICDFPKADESTHLVHIPPNGFLKFERQGYVRIDRDFEQLRLVVRQPPDEAVEQSPATIIPVQCDDAGQFDESFWNAKSDRASPACHLRRFIEYVERGLISR